MSVHAKWLVTAFLMVLVACGRIDYDPVPVRDGGGMDAPLDAPDASSADASDMAQDSAMDAFADMSMGEAGIIVAPTSGLTTTEAGGTATFTIVLESAPTANVSVALSSSMTGEGTVTPTSLTFTSANWSAPQTVTVTGVDDAVMDGDVAYTIIIAPATSTDAAYNNLDADDVSVTNLDDETAGVILSRTSGLVTDEGGRTDTFTMALTVAPIADVTISLTSSAIAEATVSHATVTFTPVNYDSPQTITVTGVDDSAVDGDAAFAIVTGDIESADTDYDGLAVPDVTGTNLDDESAAVLVSPLTGLTTSEAGGTASFTIELQSRPDFNVTVPIATTDASEGTVSVSMATFAPTNWDMPQLITITGVDDALADGDQIYAIAIGAATSADPNYDGLDAPDPSVTNTDDESAGFVLTPNTALVTTEAGGTATFTVVLRSQPTASVSFDVTSNDTSEGAVSPATLTFTTGDWDTPQTITVTGVDDAVADGDQSYEVIVHVSASADSDYMALSDRRADVINTDDESAGITVNPTSGLTTTEAGGTASFTVVLNSAPTGDVTISLASDTPLEGTASPASLTFTPANWNMPRTVTVTGVDDLVADGARVYQVVTAAAVSTDIDYASIDPADVTVTNQDNDSVGVTVTPTSGLGTTEAGATATFTIVLASQPTANVTFGLMSSDTTEGTIAPASVMFTMGNWNVPQTVTVTGVDDLLADGNVLFTVLTAAAVSADSTYNGFNPSDVTVTNVDNDMASVVVMPTSGLTTTEGGGTATFTVVLGAQPSSPVTISLASSDITEGTVSPASLMFTNLNWNVAQTVTVTGVNDAIDDGDIAYNIVTGAASSSDPAYSALVVADVSVTNTDNDAAGVTVTPTLGLVTSEAGGTATFTIVLTSQPSADVTISLTSSDLTEGTVSPASVTFMAGNWNVAQTVTVTGADDALADGNVAYTITTGAAVSTDLAYSGMAVADVSVTNNDNDAPGVTVSPTAGLVTTEALGTATFTIVLASMPTASVSISLASNDVTEGTVSPASVTFTTANWSTPQMVTVTGVDDAAADGNVAYSIITGNASSTDGSYSGLVVADVSVTNNDNDVAGVTVTPTSGLVTSEAGGTATFTVVLTSQPSNNVTIALMTSDATEGTVSPASLTFMMGTWNTPQMVTITGVNDSIVDGSVAYSIITGAASSADGTYNGMAVSDVTVTNTDNDVAGVTVNPTSGLMTTEAMGTATFTIVLTSQPTNDVTISLASSNMLEGTVSPASVTFTNGNWNSAQTVTVTGVDDFVVDGSVAYSIITGAASSSDPVYNGMAVSDVSVTNADNDTAGVTVSPTSGLVTTEALGTATFTVVLTSQPTASVSISLMSSNVLEGTVSPASLTFLVGNWNVAQTVTVTGVNDFVDDGDVAYTIVTGNGVSTDTNYSGRVVSDVSVTNADNDTVGVTVNPTAGLTTTEAGGTAMFTIVLNSQPTANVSIALASSNTMEGTVSPASVTFTNLNWNMSQTVTVTGVNDFVDDGNVAYTITTGAASSTDGLYNGIAVSDVSVSNTDNDSAGVTISPTTGWVTSEAGLNMTISVVLTSQPLADVEIFAMSDDTTEGTAGLAPVATFTALNWNIPQMFDVSGQNDLFDDGDIVYNVAMSAGSPDTTYSSLVLPTYSAINLDNDTAGVTVTPTSGLRTSETGSTATFTMVLACQPTANVSVSLTSSNVMEGTVSPASVTFTTMNWNMAQTVTITGVNDNMSDGDVAYTIVTGAASSTDAAYNGLAVADVSVTNTTLLAQEAYIKASNAEAGDEFGNDWAISLSSDGNTLAVGAWNESSSTTGINSTPNNAASDAGAAYVFVRSAGVWTQQAYIKASNTDIGDHFGTSVSLSDDGNTLVVGATHERSNATGVGGNQANNSSAIAGAAYVFTRSGSTWTQQSYIKASNTGANDYFGWNVQLSGDGDTLVVGAPNEDSNATGIDGNGANNAFVDSGAAYVFRRTAGVWAQQAYVKASNTGGSDSFGQSLGLSYDGNTMAIGALYESSSSTGINGADNDGASSSGAVYVFVRSGSVWSQQAYVKASNTQNGDQFGATLGLSADGNTLAVGALTEDSAATGVGGNQSDETMSGSGAMYVYTRSGSMWTQQAYIKASNPGMDDEFGNQSSLAMSNDGNLIAIGAHLEDSNATGINGNQADNSATDAGAVYLFARVGVVWSQVAYIKASNTGAYDEFSWVALSGDGSTLAVGAQSEDSNATGIGGAQGDDSATQAGAVYVF